MTTAAADETKLVLVVDDARVMRMLLTTWLERLGFEVIEATNGAEALQAIGARSVQAVFCDINMPGMSGLTVLDRLRKDPQTKDLPVIIISTEGKAEDIKRGLSLGATAYLTKPLQHGQLLEIVDELLGR